MDERQTLEIRGRYHPPRSSLAVDATLVRTGGELRLIIDGNAEPELSGLSLNDVKVDAQLGTIARKIYLPDGALFETPNSDSVDMMFGRSFWSDLAKLERPSPRLAVFAVACVLMVFGIWRFGVPIAADVAASVTPSVYAKTMDRGTFETLERTVFDDSKVPQARQDAIRGEFNELLAALEPNQTNHSFRLLFRKSNALGANALALPAGTIVVTDDLVDMFEGNEAVVGVLGHEIGHVVERHSLIQIYRAAGVALFFGLVLGDMGPVLDEVIVEANLLRSLAGTRAHEASADRFAVALLKKTGRDPIGLVNFFETMQQEFEAEEDLLGDRTAPITKWYSTHPATKKRIQSIREQMRASQ